MRHLVFLVMLLVPVPALADYPGADRIDHVMGGKEPRFEATDLRDLPELAVVTADGRILQLDQLSDQVVVLSFVPEACEESCAAQQTMLEKVRQDLAATPMRDMVTFVTVRPQDGLAPAEGPTNWWTVTPASDTSVIALSRPFSALSERNDGVPMTHVIARGGRHAAIFHGADFERLNMVLYINA
jgi:protein SCO1/2